MIESVVPFGDFVAAILLVVSIVILSGVICFVAGVVWTIKNGVDVAFRYGIQLYVWMFKLAPRSVKDFLGNLFLGFAQTVDRKWRLKEDNLLDWHSAEKDIVHHLEETFSLWFIGAQNRLDPEDALEWRQFFSKLNIDLATIAKQYSISQGGLTPAPAPAPSTPPPAGNGTI